MTVPTPAAGLPAADWYLDPRGDLRFWDGQRWTERVRVAAPPPPAPAPAAPTVQAVAAPALTYAPKPVTISAVDTVRELRTEAAWVAAGGPGVNVCAPHGQPITARLKLRLVSAGTVKTAFSLLGLLVGYLLTQRRLRISGWGICPQCRREKTVRTLLPVGCLLVSLLAFVGVGLTAPSTLSHVTGPQAYQVPTSGNAMVANTFGIIGGLLLLAGIVLPLTGRRPGWPAVLRMSYDRGEAFVTFKRPAPAFVAAYRARNRTNLSVAAGGRIPAIVATDPSSRFG